MASRRSWVRIPSAPPIEETKELKPDRPPTVATYCCHIRCFLLHSKMNLSRFARRAAHDALHPHRTHQRRRWEVSVRQRAVLEESPSDSNRRSNLLLASWKQGQAYAYQNRQRAPCCRYSPTEPREWQSTDRRSCVRCRSRLGRSNHGTP